MHEAAVLAIAHRETDVRGVARVPVRNDRDDIAVLQLGLHRRDAGFRNVGDRQLREARLDPRKVGEHRGIVPKVSVVASGHLHVADLAADRHATERGRRDRAESPSLVVGEDFLEVVHAAHVGAVADAVAVTLELDVVEHRLARPEVRRVLDHAGEGERGLVEGPAIEQVEIHRGRLDLVVDLEGVVAVGRATEGLADGDGAGREGKVRPILLTGPRAEL